jgi:hypothetical protein
MVARRIWVIATDSAGCWHYRLHLPLSYLDPKDFEVIISPPDERAESGDILIGQRIAGHNDAWRQMCEDERLLAVYDLDDDLLNIDPENAAPYSIYAPIAAGTADNIKAANVVTVSTPKLAEKIRGLNPNVVVLPNCLHPHWLRRLPQLQMPFTVGWAGSMFHGQDMDGLPQQLAAFHGAHPNTQWHFCGADYSGGAVPRRASPFQTMSQYEMALDFSVGMAILKKTPFNDKKSWIKVLEYAGKGIPAVASNVGQYPEFIEHGVNGYLINDVSELAATLELLTDDQHREKLSLAVFEKALEYSIENQVHRWREVYEGATP